MKLLLPYATSEGHTHTIVERIAANARDAGIIPSLYNTESIDDVPDVTDFDAAILVASVHEHEHQKSMVVFATANRDKLRSVNAAFVSVSLSAATPDGRASAQQYVDRFVAGTGWSPQQIHLTAGAMNLANCDYFQRQVVADILAHCPAIKDDNQNYVFTDWQALDGFVAGVLQATGS